MQMGNTEARDDFLNGTNGAAKLTEEDLKILDDLYVLSSILYFHIFLVPCFL